jgi:hypothetical protein
MEPIQDSQKEGDPRRITLTWGMKCEACGTSTQGFAESPTEAFVAMERFSERTCQSSHFVEES